MIGAARIRILAFTAHGGVGKSTLVNHWLREVQSEHFRGASRVFGWSFYSQGPRDQPASADPFIDAALRFFGDPDPAAGSPWDKGERLARHAGAERALLVLDGLEPLQYGHAFDRGKLRDPALHTLLRGLARQSEGLCLITTREPLSDFAGLAGVTTCDLEQISPEAGRALLRTARVVGTDAELEGLAKRFGPHALAVSLLGVYLYQNDPRHGIDTARALEQLRGDEPLDRVLVGFEQWLATSTELEALRLLGLFDRPADAGCLGALRAKPPIPGLTERAVDLSDAGWDRVLDRLEQLWLVHPQSKDTGPPVVDAQPLLREHFAKQLGERPESWRAGHRRLYEYLQSSVPYRPEGLGGLLPLGDMGAALRDAEQSVEFADRSRGAFQRMSKRTTLADARHQSGAWVDALAIFREAESGQPEYPLLYSLKRFQYCDLLLGEAERLAWAAYFGIQSCGYGQARA